MPLVYAEQAFVKFNYFELIFKILIFTSTKINITLLYLYIIYMYIYFCTHHLNYLWIEFGFSLAANATRKIFRAVIIYIIFLVKTIKITLTNYMKVNKVILR